MTRATATSRPSGSETLTSPVEISRPRRRTRAVATSSLPRPPERKLTEKPMVVPRDPGAILGLAQNDALQYAWRRPGLGTFPEEMRR